MKKVNWLVVLAGVAVAAFGNLAGLLLKIFPPQFRNGTAVYGQSAWMTVFGVFLIAAAAVWLLLRAREDRPAGEERGDDVRRRGARAEGLDERLPEWGFRAGDAYAAAPAVHIHDREAALRAFLDRRIGVVVHRRLQARKREPLDVWIRGAGFWCGGTRKRKREMQYAG
jgi:hypothetical protein